jgi:hypothetical protein
MPLQITNDDIDQIESLLLPTGSRFCETRRAFIRSLDSLDVQACPGSGKTTALLAKLLILSSKLPLPDNAGICILTHTNTAIDEIKKQFGKQASRIFQYPHYVGTIQTFIDKFLAIPAFVNKYGKRPLVIDNEQYNYEIERSRGVNLSKARFYLTQNHLTLSNLRFSFKNAFISKSLNDEQPFVGQNTPTYQTIKQHKLKVLEKGYLCFDDAYALAYQYIQQFPQISSLISIRFKYVFIDEMQDTDVHQNQIFDTIFCSGQTIVQRIGDKNQAIYTYDVREELVWQPKKLIYINGSKRLSQSIATAIKNVGLTPQVLEGDATKPAIKPILMLFNDADITKVIPYFCEQIIKYGLPAVTDKPIFKVVGWVGKEHQNKHTIPNYWPAYISMLKYKKSEQNCLDDFISLPIGDTSAAFYAVSIIDAILRFLKINGITRPDGRHFTYNTFLSFLEEMQPDLFDKLKLDLTKWILQISRGVDVFDQIKNFLIFQVAKDSKCGFQLNTQKTQDFFIRAKLPDSCTNIASSIKLPGDIPITVNTIHRVKGETHTATLYLETFNNGYDVSNVLHCFQPDAERGKLGVMQKRTLKMAYVAMSRPTHLLCVAVHKNTIGARNQQIIHDFDELQNIFGEYWQILDISNPVM